MDILELMTFKIRSSEIVVWKIEIVLGKLPREIKIFWKFAWKKI